MAFCYEGEQLPLSLSSTRCHGFHIKDGSQKLLNNSILLRLSSLSDLLDLLVGLFVRFVLGLLIAFAMLWGKLG